MVISRNSDLFFLFRLFRRQSLVTTHNAGFSTHYDSDHQYLKSKKCNILPRTVSKICFSP